MKTAGIVVKVVRRVRREEILRLYREGGWFRSEFGAGPERIDRVVSGSLCFVGVYHRRVLIGMGRAISDGTSDAYVQDVIVSKAYRRRGLGKKIVARLLKELGAKGIDWIGVIAQPGTVGFYRKLGFREMKAHHPMLLNTAIKTTKAQRSRRD